MDALTGCVWALETQAEGAPTSTTFCSATVDRCPATVSYPDWNPTALYRGHCACYYDLMVESEQPQQCLVVLTIESGFGAAIDYLFSICRNPNSILGHKANKTHFSIRSSKPFLFSTLLRGSAPCLLTCTLIRNYPGQVRQWSFTIVTP